MRNWARTRLLGALHHSNYRGLVRLVTLRTPVKWSDTSVKSPSAVVLHMSTRGMPLVHSNHLLRSKSSINKPNGFVIYSLEGQRFFTPKNFHSRFNETLCLLCQQDCHSTGPRCYAISNHVYLIPHDGMCLVFEPALNSLIL